MVHDNIGVNSCPLLPFLLSTTPTQVTNDYMARGGDGYALMGNSPSLEANGPVMDPVMTDFVIARSPVSNLEI